MADATSHVVVMGVSGCGKTTVAKRISAVCGWAFAEADEFHSVANVEKMRGGLPLTDDDRWPWLRDLSGWMAARAAAGESTVVACSALKRSYRTVLSAGPPSIVFVHLDGPSPTIRERLSRRSGHYMPASLLDSQVADLEPLHHDEPGFVLDVNLPPDELVRRAVQRLRLTPGTSTAAGHPGEPHPGSIDWLPGSG
jgi:gluconokinase